MTTLTTNSDNNNNGEEAQRREFVDPADAFRRTRAEQRPASSATTQPQGLTTPTAPAPPAPGIGTLRVTGTNPLHKYQTYNCLFTLSALDRDQLNTSNFSNPRNIICSTKGDWRYASRRASTTFGSFDYWIDDLMIVSQPSFSPDTGNMFATGITFKVTEPYSMGLFMLTCKQAAEGAGYIQNFQSAPFLLTIEFAGYVNEKPEIDSRLTRRIPITFTNVEFKVTAAGTVYDCVAVPYNEIATRDHESRMLTDVRLSGADVKTLLKGSGNFTGAVLEKSLEAALRRQQLDALRDRSLEAVDEYEIIFPKDWKDRNDTGNEISRSIVFRDNNDGGTVPFPDYNRVFNQASRIIQTTRVNITPEKNFHFNQRTKIQDIIQEVIIRSEYITRQIEGNQIKADSRGFVNWFRIETHVNDLPNNSAQYNRQLRKYIYRVLPYKIHISNFLPPNQQPQGLPELRNSVSRKYSYIYTGKNTDIIDLSLDFKMTTWAVTTPYDVGTRTGTNNANQGGLAAGGNEANRSQSPTSTGNAQIASAGPNTQRELGGVQSPVSAQPPRALGGAGNDSEKTAQTRFLVERIANEASLLNIDVTIHGDPYYLPSSGMGNQIIPDATPNELVDGSLNYQDSEVDVIMEFRTPLDLDPVSGLYKFDAVLDLYSGLYRVQRIESKFMKNNFTQVVTLNKRRGEYGNIPPTAPIAEPVQAPVQPSQQARPAVQGQGGA